MSFETIFIGIYVDFTPVRMFCSPILHIICRNGRNAPERFSENFMHIIEIFKKFHKFSRIFYIFQEFSTFSKFSRIFYNFPGRGPPRPAEVGPALATVRNTALVYGFAELWRSERPRPAHSLKKPAARTARAVRAAGFFRECAGRGRSDRHNSAKP